MMINEARYSSKYGYFTGYYAMGGEKIIVCVILMNIYGTNNDYK